MNKSWLLKPINLPARPKGKKRDSKSEIKETTDTCRNIRNHKRFMKNFTPTNQTTHKKQLRKRLTQ